MIYRYTVPVDNDRTMSNPVELLVEAEELLENKCVPEGVQVLNRIGEERGGVWF